MVKKIYLTNLERKFNLQLYLERNNIFFIILIRKYNFIENWFKRYFNNKYFLLTILLKLFKQLILDKQNVEEF